VSDCCSTAGLQARHSQIRSSSCAAFYPMRPASWACWQLLTACLIALLQVAQAARALELGTRYSRSCCKLITEDNGVSALARMIMVCNTSKPHLDVVTELLAILHNVARHDDLLASMMADARDLEVIITKLQFFRDCEVGSRVQGVASACTVISSCVC
jgi:hypothetical protein